ncbi:MAG: hypothetical protein ABI351_04365 [Herbaspirillum sp.]
MTKKTFRFVFVWLCGITLMMSAVLGDAYAEEPLSDHISGSIHSVEEADQLLARVAQQRQQIEVKNAIQQNACYDRFFVSACLSKVSEQHRAALSGVNTIEIEANIYKRRATVDERDRNLEEQRTKDIQDREDRAKQQAARDASTAEKMRQHKQDAQTAAQRGQQFEGAAQQRVAEHQAHEQQRAAKEAAAAGQRAENTAKFKQKGIEAAERQRVVAQKKAEKAEKAARKASGITTVPDATSPAAVLRP